MAEQPEPEDREGRFPEQGRVKNVKNKWAVYEDGAMAHVMQQEEFEHKYGMNRFHRRTVREDIPVARVVQSAEEEERQRKEMLRLERQKQIADEDERIAREMANNLQLQADTEQLQRQLQDEERTRRLLQEEDENIRQDEELARQLQEREKEKFERKRLERERRKLEQQIANERVEAERLLAAYRQEVQAGNHDNQHNLATESLQNGAPPDRPPPPSNSPNNNLFADIDPTLQRPPGYDYNPRRQEPEPQQPLPDLQLSAQRTPATGPGSPGDEQYAEVGDFSPVAGQRRNTIPKKGKEKKPSGKNKNSNCKQQ